MDTPPEAEERPAQRLCRTFAAACEREGVRGVLRETDTGLAVEFADQENAPGPLILHHFGLELGAAGIDGAAVLHQPGSLAPAEVERLVQGLDLAVRRIRVLLIEHNSFHSGGLPWVFPPAEPLLVARGLSIYRYPKTAAVEVAARGAAIRVEFAPGALGTVTSSGFYVPTKLTGDFTATLRYDLRSWRPGPTTASLALFAQDEPSLHRYYAQRNSGPGAAAPHAALAHFNAMLWPGVAVAEPGGWFRLEREQGRVRAWHKTASGSEFVELGDLTGEPHPDVFLGAKVWSLEASGGLVAEFSELEVRGRLAATQPPPPDVRPDPRRATEAP